MTQGTDGWGAAGRAAAAPAPPFDRLIDMHRSAAIGSRRAAYLLIALGCALAAIGLLADGWGWLLATGVVTGLVALVPLKKAVEHGERAEGLSVLHEEWRDSRAGIEIERLRELIGNLYAARPMRSPEPATEPA